MRNKWWIFINGRLFSNTKEHTTETYNMDEFQKHYAEWKKSNTEEITLYESMYVRFHRQTDLWWKIPEQWLPWGGRRVGEWQTTSRENTLCFPLFSHTISDTRCVGFSSHGPILQHYLDTLRLNSVLTLSTWTQCQLIPQGFPHFRCQSQVLGFPLYFWQYTYDWNSHSPLIGLNNLLEWLAELRETASSNYQFPINDRDE